MNLIYVIHNSFIKLLMMFIEKNLKTIVCMIKEKKNFVDIEIKQDSFSDIKEQKNKKCKILNFIKKKNENNDNLKKKSKFLFKNISKIFVIHFQNWINVSADSSNFSKKKDFKIKKKCDENLNDLFLEIKVEEIKKFKLFVIKNFDMNNIFDVYKKEIVFYETLNQVLQKHLMNWINYANDIIYYDE